MSPAAWTAVSAIAVALIGAVVTLTTTWWTVPKSPPPAEQAGSGGEPPTASSAAAATTAEPSSLTGRWSGEASEPGGAPFPVELEVTAGCAMNAACGTIAVPHVPCRGRITLISSGPDGFEFHVDAFDAASNASVCTPGAGEVIKALADGTLSYTATYSGARGILTAVE